MSQLKLSLVRSLIGSTKRQRDSVRGLGLKRVNDTVLISETPAGRGMIDKVSHLVSVEKLEG